MNAAALRKKIRRAGASNARTPSRLTADPARASVIRDPISGRAVKPDSPEGAKWLKLKS